LNSTTHPNEESNRVLKALFLEKKKVKALEQRLKEIGQKGHVDHPGPEALEDMRKMRQLFLLLKQKYAQALTTLKEYESKESESQALLQQINQLKSTQSNFQQKLTHLDEENEALRIQLKHAKKLIGKSGSRPKKLRRTKSFSKAPVE
jgi:chromosome segregation ATPase